MKKMVLLVVLLSAISAAAQTDRATLTGTITDPAGKRIVGAKIVIKSIATGVDVPSTSNSSGVYTVTALSTGMYQVAIEADGFAPVRIDNVSLDVGQTRILDSKLTVAGTVEQIEVADSGLSNSDASISGVVHGQQAADLPIDGRSFVGLISLVPGAIGAGTGQGQDVRFAGLSDEDNVWHLDGVDNSGINNSFVDVNMRLQVSTEAIAEFKASSVAYSADEGGQPGGQIEVVSKTGGDHYHGATWEFVRNNIFDAAPWDSHGQLPPLHLNNFGANIGGPILKKRFFFFANYEASLQHINQLLTATVPSASYRAEVASAQPELAPLINAYPTGQIPISADSATWYGSGPQVTNENSGLARADYRINDKMYVFARFSTDHFTQSKPDGMSPSTAFHNEFEPSAVIGAHNTFSPTILNDFRFGFNRTQSLEGQTTPFPFLLSISPFASLDTPSGTTRNDNSFTAADDATFQRGRHMIKAGIEILREQENKASPNSPDWELTYTSTTAFLANQMNSDYFRGANPLTGARLTEDFGYILDEFKASHNINLNVGLRYEYFGVDHEVLGRGILVDPIHCPDVICPAGTPWYQSNVLDFEPRISATWSPEFSHGKLAVRSGFGIYFGNGQYGARGTPIGNLSTNYTLNQTQDPGLGYPVSPNAGVGAASGSPGASDIHRKDVAVDEWTLSIQEEVARQTVIQVAYFGTAGSHLMSDYELNGINPATGTRPYAGYSTMELQDSTNHASTDALQASIKREYSTGLELMANYEWSHSINNGGIGGGEANMPENVHCFPCERASSAEDMRNYLTASSIWQIPVGRGRTFLSIASKTTDMILGGWQLSTIGYFRSGLPLNVKISRPASALPDQLNGSQRPNRVPGVPLYPAHRTVNNWLNPAAFSTPASGTWGNLGRDAVNAPDIWQIDPSVNKRFPVAERFALNFRAEAFNVLNVAQYGSPATTWAPPSGGSQNPNNFGAITSSYNTNPTGTGTPRELQLSMKLEF